MPSDSKVYSFYNAPVDGQPHWISPSSGIKKYYSVGYLALKGFGTGRTAEEAKKPEAADFSDPVFDLTNEVVLGITADVLVYSNGSVNRSLFVYLKSTPEEGEKQIGSVMLDMDGARKLSSHLDDMLRIGRKWRSEGVAKESKKVSMSTISSPLLNKFNLNMSIEKVRSNEHQGWNIWSDRVHFQSIDLAALSILRDKVKMAVDWLERQR